MTAKDDDCNFLQPFCLQEPKEGLNGANIKPDLERHASISNLKSAMFGICKRLGP